jgi:glycosyltransferase involved in cell wall biosynthesis
MKKKIILYSQNLAFKVGGAESCIFSMFINLKDHFNVELCSGLDSRLLSYDKHAYPNVNYIKVYHIDNLTYAKLVINTLKTFLHFNAADADVVISNCCSGVGVALKSILKGKKTIYYVHEEYSLNQYTSYTKPSTVKSKFLRLFKNFVDYPFFFVYKLLNYVAIKKSDVVFANSIFIKNALSRKFNSNAIVVYPFTKTKGNCLYSYCKDGYITMVGDGYVKGVETFKAIANLMPEKKFRIVAKSSNYHRYGNLTICPFFENIEELYQSTSIFLVPSIWREAFGKVSIEASSRGIPVFVSSQGALPETVLSESYVVNEYLNPEAWKDKITNFETGISSFDNKSIVENAYKFDESEDTKKTIDILKRLTCNA